MEKLVKLFEPGKVGKLEVKNRIVMAPYRRDGEITHLVSNKVTRK